MANGSWLMDLRAMAHGEYIHEPSAISHQP
jgi:hypothetical protein